MPSFRYTAVSPAGELVQGVLEAASEHAVIEKLRQQGSLPMRAEPAEKSRGLLRDLLSAEFGRGRALSPGEVTNITRELAVMLAAGQDLDRALRFLVDTAPNLRMRGVLGQLRDAVRDGSPFAVALAQHPQSFPRLYVGLIRAGEAGGMLAATLARLADLLERERALRSSVISALVYPAILVVTGVGAIVMLLTWVLPQFVPMFQQAGAALPTPTRIVIGLGDFFTAYGLYLLLTLLALGVVGRQALKRPAVRAVWDRNLLRVPVIGSLSRELLAARFARTLGTLLQNGVPLVSALGIVIEVIGNSAGEAAVRVATESAKGGAGLARPLQQSGLFPLRMVYLLRLGEETAQLGPMAIRAAEIHEEQSRLGIERLVALMVPVLIILIGGAVAGIVSSLMLAMLSLNDLAQ
ncbi:MAG TPA: type II secretion system F family protein [Acetobacteraceae bacterium]|nr:type II secretion system F family protein [Acetobacteraceae bacterium]